MTHSLARWSRWVGRLALLGVLGLWARPESHAAAPVVVKLGTVAPEGTTWYNALRSMADRWSQISGGRVAVKIYAGAVLGSEGAMVRKMRIGQLHAAAMTNLGILDIDPAPQVINTPMLIRSYEELDFVMGRMAPTFDARLLERGFVALNWGEAGWARLFSKKPVHKPADASGVKIYTWDGDANAVEVFRQAGFSPVVLASTDVLPSLQSGLVEAFPSPPLGALSMQWFALAPHMLDVPWAPLVGGTVITRTMWDRIPAEYHAPFLQVARETGEILRKDVRSQDRKAVAVMEKYGLQVVQVDAATRAQWESTARSLYPFLRTKVVPTEIFDETVASVEAYRATH
ncbi:MAG: TRAP transporter substrate-binding protein DctP [Deltaproteobacteria bacterium]|nr:TRAP transporter substrate-binding protein DctP [Deltaproteobacteria bacterium]